MRCKSFLVYRPQDFNNLFHMLASRVNNQFAQSHNDRVIEFDNFTVIETLARNRASSLQRNFDATVEHSPAKQRKTFRYRPFAEDVGT